jgi:hypothetical protein
MKWFRRFGGVRWLKGDEPASAQVEQILHAERILKP